MTAEERRPYQEAIWFEGLFNIVVDKVIRFLLPKLRPYAPDLYLATAWYAKRDEIGTRAFLVIATEIFNRVLNLVPGIKKHIKEPRHEFLEQLSESIVKHFRESEIHFPEDYQPTIAVEGIPTAVGEKLVALMVKHITSIMHFVRDYVLETYRQGFDSMLELTEELITPRVASLTERLRAALPPNP